MGAELAEKPLAEKSAGVRSSLADIALRLFGFSRAKSAAAEISVSTPREIPLFLDVVRELDKSNCIPVSGAPKEFQHLRKRSLGEVRLDLKEEEVIEFLHHQLLPYRESDIRAVIESFPVEEQAIARSALAASARFSTPESFDVLCRKIAAHRGPEKTEGSQLRIATPIDDSLGALLLYFRRKELLERNIERVSSPREGAVVVDDRLLFRLSGSKAFAEEIRSASPSLYCPRGYSTGINLFNAPTLEDLTLRIREIVQRARSIANKKGAPRITDEVIAEALDQPIIGRLREIEKLHGLKKGSLTSRLVMIDGAPSERVVDPSDSELAAQLNGDVSNFPEKFRRANGQLPAAYRPLFLDFLCRHAEFYSFRSLSRMARDHYRTLCRHAQLRGVAPEAITFHMADSLRSFNLVNLLYRAANKLDLAQFLTTQEIQEKNKRTMLVKLDDLAGGGNTLSAWFNELPFQHVVVAPLISTDHAQKRFRSERKKSGDGSRVFLPRRVIPTFGTSRFLAGMGAVENAELSRLLGDLGHTDTGLALAFPYMAPDNNSHGFANLFAGIVTRRWGAIRNAGSTLDLPNSSSVSKIVDDDLFLFVDPLISVPGVEPTLDEVAEGLLRTRRAQKLKRLYGLETKVDHQHYEETLSGLFAQIVPREIERVRAAIDADRLRLQPLELLFGTLDRALARMRCAEIPVEDLSREVANLREAALRHLGCNTNSA